MGSQPGGEVQVTCLSVRPAGMAPKMGLRHRFPALGRKEQREGYCPGFLLSLLRVHLSGAWGVLCPEELCRSCKGG